MFPFKPLPFKSLPPFLLSKQQIFHPFKSLPFLSLQLSLFKHNISLGEPSCENQQVVNHLHAIFESNINFIIYCYMRSIQRKCWKFGIMRNKKVDAMDEKKQFGKTEANFSFHMRRRGGNINFFNLVRGRFDQDNKNGKMKKIIFPFDTAVL